MGNIEDITCNPPNDLKKRSAVHNKNLTGMIYNVGFQRMM
jgi:hypothetical protein